MLYKTYAKREWLCGINNINIHCNKKFVKSATCYYGNILLYDIIYYTKVM